MALFRLDERAGAYFTASIANVLLTIALTVWLVVGSDEGARGLLLGNFGASAVVLAGALLARTAGALRLAPVARGAAPDAALRPAHDARRAVAVRAQLHRPRHAGARRRPGGAGLYSLAVKFSQVVTVLVRGFNLAWPPLAYSIRDDDEARRTYAVIVTYYLLLSFTVVLAPVAGGALGRAGAGRARSSSTPTRRCRWSPPA